MLASPVTMFDVDAVCQYEFANYQIAGKSVMGLSFPSVAGSEGVGIAQKIGEEVTSIGEKDTVMIVRPVQGRI